MGGKRNQAARVKGNARPSSSGRTAEKLASLDGGVPLGLMGFTGFALDSTFGADDADSSIDVDFRLTMKKMTKKDSTTKLKAVQEFTSLCKERPVEQIKSSLVFWPRLFNKLAVDHDRRIREAVFQAHEVIVSRTRKNLAPYLRSIMGTWLICQCDPYLSAASAAKNSFEAAFLPPKQPEAIVFCKTEILEFIEDNLFHQTARTLSDPETTSAEDMESKYVRILSSSLLGWKLFIETISPKEHQSLEETYRKMLAEPKFWKLAKHQSPLVRIAWFRLTSTVCNFILSAINEKKLCPLVLGNLDESDPTVSPAVWEAALFVLVKIEDCWQHVNAKKAIVPKLWTVLQEGGYGNAATIFPHLLPFINKIPSDVMEDAVQFYKEFFGRMRKGLELHRVQTSTAETNSIIQSFVECLKYVVLTHIDISESKLEFLLLEQFLPLICCSLQENTSKLRSSCLYEEFRNLMLVWHRNAAANSNYRKLENFLLKHVEDVCKETLEANQDSSNALLRLSNMLIRLIDNRKSSKSESRVRFSDESTQETIRIDDVIDVKEGQPFHELICNVCLTAVDIATQRRSTSHFNLFSTIVHRYPVSDLFFRLCRQHLSGDAVEDVGATFFHRLLFPWTAIEEIQSDKDFPSSFVNLTLASYACASEKSKLEILNYICKVQNPRVLECLLKRVENRKDDTILNEWLQSSELEAVLQEFTTKLCTSDSQDINEDIWGILSFCFSAENDKEMLFSATCLEKVLHIFRTALAKNGELSDRNMRLLCNLGSKFFNCCWMTNSSEELLYTMFVLLNEQPDFLNVNLLRQVEKTWLIGSKMFLATTARLINETGYLKKTSEYLHRLLLSDDLSKKTFDSAVDSTKKFVQIAQDLDLKRCKIDEEIGGVECTKLLFGLLLPSSSKWKNLRQRLDNEWMLRAAVDDKLVFTKLDETSFQELPESNYGFVSTSAFFTKLFLRMMESDEEHEKETKRKLFMLLQEFLITPITEIIFANVYWNMTRGFKKNCNFLFESFAEDSSALLNLLAEGMDEDQKIQITKDIQASSLTEGGLWCLCLEKVSRIFALKEPCDFTLENYVFPLEESQFHTAFVKQENTIATWNKSPLMALLETKTDCQVSLIQLIALSHKQLRSTDAADPIAQDLVKKVIDLFISWQEEKVDRFLFSCDISTVDWILICLNVELSKLLSFVIDKYAEILERHHWDFVLCGLISWMQCCCESEESLWNKLNVLLFVHGCCALFSVVDDTVQNICEGRRNCIASDLKTEWTEFFTDGLFSNLLSFVIPTIEKKLHDHVTDIENDVIVSMTLSVCKIPINCLQDKDLRKMEVDKEDAHIPLNLRRLLTCFCHLLQSSVRPIQLCAYRLLEKLIPQIAHFVEKQVVPEDSTEENHREIPFPLKLLLTEMTATVNAFFAEFGPHGNYDKIDATLQSCVMCYLLAWNLIIELVGVASLELRSEYLNYLESSGLIHDLLCNLFYLIPENATLQDSSRTCVDETAPSKSKTMFSEEPKLNFKCSTSEKELQHVACQVYFKAIRKLPSLVRQWWLNQDKRTLSLVEKITSKYVSGILIANELQIVQQKAKQLSSKMRARSKTAEIVLEYEIDKVSLELVIQLAQNHPLERVKVECVKQVGVGHTQWRNWLLQLNTFLTHQNGSILEVLLLWMNNMDKKLGGVEECYICYYVLHGSNCQLPRLSCKTCKKKFHSACLFQWFRTSNQSTCPLCRNLF